MHETVCVYMFHNLYYYICLGFVKSAQMIIVTDHTSSSNDAMSCEILEGLGVVELFVVSISIVLIDISRYGLGVYPIKF